MNRVYELCLSQKILLLHSGPLAVTTAVAADDFEVSDVSETDHEEMEMSESDGSPVDSAPAAKRAKHASSAAAPTKVNMRPKVSLSSPPASVAAAPSAVQATAPASAAAPVARKLKLKVKRIGASVGGAEVAAPVVDPKVGARSNLGGIGSDTGGLHEGNGNVSNSSGDEEKVCALVLTNCD
jgi:hypothetical protein